jgi:hypothetical protein
MWLRFTLLFFAAIAIGFAKSGDLSLTVRVVLWISPILLLASYFFSRQGATANRGERLTAYGWLVIRLFFCFTGAVLLFVAGVVTVVTAPLDVKRVIGVIGLCALSAFLIWSGMYGESRSSHRKRMARYYRDSSNKQSHNQ